MRQLHDVVGRGVVATAALCCDSTVVRPCDALVTYPTAEASCAFCARPLPDRVIHCTNPFCHEEYCIRDCRTLALGLCHAPVCTNTAFQSTELDAYAQPVKAEREERLTDRNAAAAELLMLRVLTASVQRQTIPSAMGEMRLLTGRLTFSPQRVELHLPRAVLNDS